MPTRFRRIEARASLQVHLGIRGKEVRADFDRGYLGGRDAKLFKDGMGDPFIDQDAPPLRIGLKLDGVVMAVFRLHQMGLGASPEFADELSGANGHAILVDYRRSWPKSQEI